MDTHGQNLQDFISLFSLPQGGYGQDFALGGSIVINRKNFNSNVVHIKNSSFQDIRFELIKTQAIMFESCSFSSVSIHEVEILDQFAPVLSKIIFIDCQINGLSISRCTLRGTVNIQKCKIGLLKFDGCSSISCDLIISSIIQKFKADSCKGFRLVKIDCSEVDKTWFNDVKAEKALFIGSRFISRVLMYDVDLGDSIRILECTFESGIGAYGVGGKSFEIEYCSFNDFCTLVFLSLGEAHMFGFSKMNIHSCVFLQSFTINGNGTESIPSFHADEIMLEFSNNSKGFLKIADIDVEDFIMVGSNMGTDIILDTVSYTRLLMNDFSNYGNLKFINGEVSIYSQDSLFSMINSYLGKAQFVNFNFSSFASVTIRNSFLSEITTSNVIWFSPDKLNRIGTNHMKHLDGSEDWSVKREIYRQLKKASEMQVNRVDSLMFLQREMIAYERQLRYTPKKSLQDYIILLMNYSNDHGQNWWRPIWLGTVTTLLLYIAIIISASNEYHFSFTCNLNAIGSTLHFLYDETGLFFQLFNPARNLGTIFKDRPNFTLTGLVHFWDLLQRIIISYFIFQTVSAFRKYTKN